MDVKITEESKDKIIVEIAGDSQTISNMVRDELWNDKDVTFAAYEKKHPYLGNPKIIVKSKDPKKSLKGALDRSIKNIDELGKEFDKALKK